MGWIFQELRLQFLWMTSWQTSEFGRRRSPVRLCQIAESFAALHCRLLKSREKFRQPYLQFFKALASLVSRDESLVSRDETFVSRDENLVSREDGNLLLSGTVHFAMLPTQWLFGGETVLLLDVMWPWSNQLKCALLSKKSLQNSNICYKFCCSPGLHESAAVLEAVTTITGFNMWKIIASTINHLTSWSWI